MTFNEQIALAYLSDKMEATAEMIGIAVWGTRKAHPSRKGGALLGLLSRKGLVMRLPELRAWRLTKKGREWVKKLGDK